MTTTSKAIVAAVVACAVIFLIFIYTAHKQPSAQNLSDNSSSTAQSSSTATSQAIPTTTAAQASASTGNPSPSTQTPAAQNNYPPPPFIIHLITPVPNDVWKIGTTNPISWDKAPNFTGEIDLIDATTNKVIGVILSQIGPSQTSYGWNTREYALSRYSPLGKDIVQGTYRLQLKFDGNNLQTVVSPVFTIVN